MEITIRLAGAGDAAVLSALGRKTFYEKWKETTSAENMNRYLEHTYSTRVIEKELAEPSLLYLLANLNHDVIAFAKLTHGFPDVEEAEPG